MENYISIQTTSLINSNLLAKNDLKIGSLDIQESSELTKQALLKELAIQRHNLSRINEDNLHGYLTPRDVQKALYKVQDNINNLVELLLEKEEVQF